MWSETCRIFNVWEALSKKPKIVDAVEEKTKKIGFLARVLRLFRKTSE